MFNPTKAVKMAINIEELKQDREEGTDGPWWTDDKYSADECGVAIIAARTDCGALPGNPTRGMVAWASEMLPENADRCEANARRIARLPDLEAAFLEAVEVIKAIAAGASVSLDDDLMQGWRKIATDRIDIAREFLEKLK